MSAPQYVRFPNHRPRVYNPALMLTTFHTEEQSGATMDTETGCTVYRAQPAKDNIALRLVAHKDNPARPKPRALQANLHKLRLPGGFGTDGAGSFKAELLLDLKETRDPKGSSHVEIAG